MKSDEFKKFDDNKPMVRLVESEFVLGVAAVATFGAGKYGEDNWKFAKEEDIKRYKDAAYRHWLAYLGGEHTDFESGLPHLDHLAWNVMALGYLEKRDCCSQS